MLTSDAKPDPPRTESNDTYTSLKTGLSYKYVPENTQKIISHGSSMYNMSFTEESKNSPTQLLYSRSNDENPASILNEDDDQITQRSREFSKHLENSTKVNIVNCNGVKIGSTTKYVCNFNQFNKSSKNIKSKHNILRNSHSRQMSDAIKKWSTSNSELTTQDMYVIKTHVGYNWRHIFLSLGYSNGQLDQFTENHKSKGIGEIIYQILLDWKCANGKTARIGNMIKILWTHKEYDCVDRLVAVKSEDQLL